MSSPDEEPAVQVETRSKQQIADDLAKGIREGNLTPTGGLRSHGDAEATPPIPDFADAANQYIRTRRVASTNSGRGSSFLGGWVNNAAGNKTVLGGG